jgi:hypothetical protein
VIVLPTVCMRSASRMHKLGRMSFCRPSPCSAKAHTARGTDERFWPEGLRAHIGDFSLIKSQ